MLSHERLPPERETLEYAWQLEIILGRLGARLTTSQVSEPVVGHDSCISPSRLDGEKMLGFLKNFYLQIMEDANTLVRSPVIDKTKWIEKLKYDVLRFSLDSVDLGLVEVGNAVNIQVREISVEMKISLSFFLSLFL